MQILSTLFVSVLCTLSQIVDSSASELSPLESRQVQKRQEPAMVGTGLDGNDTVLGNYYNYWRKFGNGTFDLTRSDRMATTSPKAIPMSGSRKEIIIEPSRTGLVIIDMQNFFLQPALEPKATGGRKAVTPTVDMVNGFRKHGMKILWTQWGLDNYDLLTIPPSFKSGFSTNDLADESFGSDMGSITISGKKQSLGRLLMRGSWNAQPYGPLNDLKVNGVAAGTDLYFNKNRLSGLWGAQTPLGLWLQENEITTLFFGGVNADQCVWSTFVDAYFKGYDVIYVTDISATTSPEYATQMVEYNADGYGFLANSTGILKALG